MTSTLHQRYRILHVEDNDLDAEAVLRGLRKLGFQGRIDRACDGHHGLAILRSDPEGDIGGGVRVVLLDLNMPRMNGHEFLAALRQDTRLQSVPVIVLTTSDALADVREAQRLHANGYIVKPPAGSQMLEALNAICSFIKVCTFAPQHAC